MIGSPWANWSTWAFSAFSWSSPVWLSTINLKIFSKFALFSYFPSDVEKDIDGSFKVTPMSSWLLSLNVVSKLDNACTFRRYQHGPWIPWCLQTLCAWLKFIVIPFKICLICLMIVAAIHLLQTQKSIRLIPDLCKRIKMHLYFVCLLTYQTEPQNSEFFSKIFDISWPLYKNLNFPWIHIDGNVNMKESVLD